MIQSVLAVINVGNLSSSESLFAHGHTLELDNANKQVLRIRCKYYHACVAVRELQDEKDVHDIEGSILYFDAEKNSSWQDAQRWMNVIDRAGIPLRLLVCHRIPPASHSFYQMAVEKQFELIELDPNPDDIEEGEEFGVRRIKSALEAHLWPNMELLDPSLMKHPVLIQLNPSVVHTSATTPDNASPCKTPDQSSPTTDSATLESTEERNLADKLNVAELRNDHQPNQTDKGADHEREQSADSEDEENLLDEQSIDSFERAFRAILTTRERVGQLDHASRRKMAEKLTLQLWRAVGGSPDEVDGLSAESSDEVDGTC